VQGRDTVCWLGTWDWQLREVAGEPRLVRCQWDRSNRLPEEKRHRWHVGTPTIRAESGKFLATDPKGRSPTVHLVSDTGAHTRWTFEIVSRLQPSRAKDKSGLKEGSNGFLFRVIVAEGPFRNWYLAAEEPVVDQVQREGQGHASRRLKLVREVQASRVFTYVEDNYFVDHK
jgi:hypothetical protein